jgi:hypothetical protein
MLFTGEDRGSGDEFMETSGQWPEKFVNYWSK